MKQIVFFDITCPKPYDKEVYNKEGMGGTEATIIRIAECLTNEYEVYVLQHNRDYHNDINGVMYRPLEFLKQLNNPYAIISLRNVVTLPFLQEQCPNSKLFLWLHDLEGVPSLLGQSWDILQDIRPTLITVSDFHLTHIKDILLQYSGEETAKFNIKYIYNPLEPTLPSLGLTDLNKWMFMSSPHKGLDLVLSTFKYVQPKVNPKAKLYIANPGYIPDSEFEEENIVNLGSLPHAKLMEHLSTAFCVFYPNTKYGTRETFGLVFAEANALEVPVIAHKMGAAREVLNPSNEQVLDCRDNDIIVKQLLNWYDQYPSVKKQSQFDINKVKKEWIQLLTN